MSAGAGRETGAPEASFLLPADADPSILGDFIVEAGDHLEGADLNLLTLEIDPSNKEGLDAVFRAFHSIKGVAGFLGLEGVKSLAHEAENLLDRARTGGIRLRSEVMDCVFDSVAFLKRCVADLKKGVSDEDDARSREESAHLRARICRLLEGDVLPGPKAPIATGASGAKAAGQGLRAQHACAPAAGPMPGSPKETVKVDAGRLDRLLDTIGELVIAESMILGSPELKGLQSHTLLQQMGQLDKITRELQEMGTSLRMVPIRPTFQKMARLVRDLAKSSGKAVNFVTVGEETELDKTVVEKIGDPLVHMLRNSLDHGIEAGAGDREAAGKPATATVRLSAFQKGGNVCIEIADDGRGLDREAILAKARERGLLGPGSDPNPPDREVWGYIFEAGFSTAKRVTELSGRGVGMDVVKRNIEALRGRIDIRSETGKGTVFSIWLPLTLAIIDGMVVRMGRERYVFPTLSVVRIVPYKESDRLTVRDRGEMVAIEDELVPLFPLQGYFFPPEPAGDPGHLPLLVIAESEGRKAAFPVDELLGQQQIVIKKLEEAFPDVPGISGGAILPDGCVGLILDMDSLMKMGF